jgi:hypothetical protein
VLSVPSRYLEATFGDSFLNCRIPRTGGGPAYRRTAASRHKTKRSLYSLKFFVFESSPVTCHGRRACLPPHRREPPQNETEPILSQILRIRIEPSHVSREAGLLTAAPPRAAAAAVTTPAATATTAASAACAACAALTPPRPRGSKTAVSAHKSIAELMYPRSLRA